MTGLAPGFFRSEMTEQFPNGYIDSQLARVPAGRNGDPDELAAAVVFLASPAANYITGTTLIIDGGLTALSALLVASNSLTSGLGAARGQIVHRPTPGTEAQG